MFTTGDLCQFIYGYEQYSTKPYRHRELSDTVLFMLHHPTSGKAEVLRPDGRVVVCSLSQLRLCVSTRDQEYAALRALVFPEQQAITPHVAPALASRPAV